MSGMDERIKTCKQENQIDAFDWGLYAALIRKARKDLGFSTAQAFAYSIYRRTRIRVSRETLYKIETAKQVPSTTVFMAINLALYKEPFPRQIIEFCLCQEWKDMLKHFGDIPTAWKHENLEDAKNDLLIAGIEPGSYSMEDVAQALGDQPNVFSANGIDDVYIGSGESLPF